MTPQVSGLTAALVFLIATGCAPKPAKPGTVSDPLLAPLPQGPLDGKAYRFHPGDDPPTIKFTWRHGMPTAQIPNPHQAERVIVCVYEAQHGRCESGSREGVLQPIWFEAGVDDPEIERRPIRQARPPFGSTTGVHVGYEFQTSLRMRPGYIDHNLLWQVGACLGGTCRISDPRRLRMRRSGKPEKVAVPGN